jgi:hypothetical protein
MARLPITPILSCLAASWLLVGCGSPTGSVADAAEAPDSVQTSAAALPDGEACTVFATVRTETGGPVSEFSVSVRDPGFADRLGDVWVARFPIESIDCFGIRNLVVPERDPSDLGVVRFQWDDVPRAELSAHCLSDDHPSEVDLSRRADGDWDLSIVLLDRPDGPGYGFRPLNDDDRFELRYPMLRTFDGNGTASPVRWLHPGRIEARVDPREDPFEWTISASGLVPVHGDSSDFVHEGGGRWFVPIELREGFGERITVRDESGALLPGVSVIVDGEYFGVTDDRGRFDVQTASRPGRISVQADGYRVVRDDWQGPSHWGHTYVLTPEKGS